MQADACPHILSGRHFWIASRAAVSHGVMGFEVVAVSRLCECTSLLYCPKGDHTVLFGVKVVGNKSCIKRRLCLVSCVLNLWPVNRMFLVRRLAKIILKMRCSQ
jgi:hypothetical protein